MASNDGEGVQLRSVLMHGRDTRFRAVVVGTNAATITLAAAIGSTGFMEFRNETGEYVEILGMRIYDSSGNAFPFYTYIEAEHERQWTQGFAQGAGIHSFFMGANGPWGTPLFWKDSAGPGRSNRTWGMRGLAPRETMRVSLLNLAVTQPVIRCEFIARTMAANIPGTIGTSYNDVLRQWNNWQATYQQMYNGGEHGDEHLFKTGGVYKHYPLFDMNMPGVQNNRAVANFGSLVLAANGESGPVSLPFPSTKEGLVVIHSFFATSTGDFEFEFFGGGYESVRDGIKSVSGTGTLQANAGRTNNNFYTEGLFSVPRPYNVQQPPGINVRDVSGAPNNVFLAFSGISIPRDIWIAGSGAK